MSLDVTLERRVEVYEANITHNLAAMAEGAGIYRHLWRPDEIGVETAGELIEPLRQGLLELESNPERFRAFDAENGWGTYDDFVPWVRRYLEACQLNPDAEIRISR